MPQVIPPGTDVTFPVTHTDPLAQFQSARVPTEQDISAHPVYSRILDERFSEALAAHPIEQQTPELASTIRFSVLNAIIGQIEPIWIFQLDDITVTAGQTLTFQSSWSTVEAGDVRSSPMAASFVA